MAIQQNKSIQTAEKNSAGIVIEENDTNSVPYHRIKQPTFIRQMDFLQVFFNNNGLVLKTCDMLHMKYSTYQSWLKDPKFKAKFDTAQQRVNEIMENSLIRKALTTNSPIPEIFYLKSRDSRYSQRVTLEGEDDKPIQITYSKDILNTISKSINNILTKE